ncbi:DUF3578 domain-containing protein [Alginatibacterium sediminis]|uniref:DUF3578 domain-containing protein n=1 Tax=Alginatibacterium sediminis TaxID=2164068 RepID=A0A420EN75_9ALTE|nr:DUF3578 domain-containing protein [Alginatibacterium sediminis]RKF22128.1 DUF3578 domain-containing protein [Alginatibacterium sediminis]
MSLRQLLTEIAGGWAKAKNEQFTGHPIATLLRQELVKAIKNTLPSTTNYLVKASAGAGNWADVPWLSILNPSITESTQSGIYPVYLFRSDGSGVYLSLGFGTTELKRQYGTALAKQKAEELRNSIRGLDKRLNNWDQRVDLRSNTTLGKSYEWASAGAKFYPLESMPDEIVLISDLKELLEVYAGVNLGTNNHSSKIVRDSQFLSKPFLLLAGISGTGKTRFVREQVKATGSLSETYCLTSVRPDWHEPSDLLGYVSRIKGKAEYVSTDVIAFLAKAWRAIVNNGFVVSQQVDDNGESKLVVQGDSIVLNTAAPYWLCLDEMNLAPVEQYFADYLSIIETRQWYWDDSGKFTYGCDALLSASVINHNDYSEQLRQQLGFEEAQYDSLWQLFCAHGISIPFNLIVAGTVNMDETTHGFSRKVIDRALTFDFGEFFPNNIDEFFKAKSEPKKLSYPIYSQAEFGQFSSITADPAAEKAKAFFKAINAVLQGTPFELAFRAFNELCLSVISFAPENDEQLAAVFDDFLMCKVLPRIEGDEDKLQTLKGEALLQRFKDVIANELESIWEGDRVDLLRQFIGSDDSVIKVKCRSKIKLECMQTQLDSGFTSFWP